MPQESRDQSKLTKQITSVFSSANQAAKSIVTTAARKSYSVTKTIANVQSMQAYNEEKEA